MGIHTIQFIAEIQKRPCLWNNNLENYNSNKLAKQQAWDEIAQIMFHNWRNMDATFKTEKLREIQKKWKGLRDYFARSRNNGPKHKHETDRRKRRKAPSLKMLQFLNITKPEDSAQPEQDSEESDSSFSSSAKSKKIQVNIETEKLITAVQTRKCLWNYNLPDYNDKDMKQQAWMEIAVILYDDFLNLSDRHKREVVRHLQKKWKGLRDYFTRQKAKERANKGEKPQRKRKAPFLAMLQFLDIPHIPKPDDNVNEQNESSHHEDNGSHSDISQSSPSYACSTEISNCKKKIKKNSLKKNVLDTPIDKAADPDMNFLLNILPDMKSMTERQNFDFRFEVMKLIKNIKYNQPSEYTYESTVGSSLEQDVPVPFSWHTSGSESKPSEKPPFRHQVIIREYPKHREGGDILSNESGRSSVEDIKAILRESSDEESD